MKKDANFLKKEREADLAAAKKVDGFVINGAYVALGGDYATKDTGLIAENKWYENLDGVKTAYLNVSAGTLSGTSKLYLPKGYTTSGAKVLQGKIASANPDAKKFDEVTDNSNWKVTAITEGNVWAVSTTNEGSLTVKDVVDAGLATEVAGKVIVNNSNKVVQQDEKNYIVDADKPAYVVDGKTYGKVEDAKNAVIEKIAADEATDLAPAARAVINSTIDSVAHPDFTYWVEIKTKEDDTTEVLDLAGVLKIGTTKNKAEDSQNKFRLDTSLDNRVYDNNTYVEVDDEWTFEPDSRSVVKFDKDADDVVLYFGENEAAWYEFDARGQDALNLEFTFDFNKEIADLFPKANIDFLTFTSKPATNRTGDLYITADEDTFLYEVTEDGVKEIQGAKYNEEEGAWHIRTRKLGAYAISDIELDTSVKVEGKDDASSNSSTSSKPNGDKHNPDTGR